MKKLLIIIGISIFIISSGFVLWDDRDDFELLKNMEIFHNVMNQLRNYYVDEIDSRELITTAINDMLEKLDPYTVYYSESQVEDYRAYSESNYVGIGITTQIINNKIFIVDLTQNFNADLSGLKIGDEIVAVNGVSVAGMNINDFSNLMRGDLGTYVNLKIKRNKKELEFKIKRQKIDIDPLSYSEVVDDIGYIRLESFSQNSAAEFSNELKKLENKNIKGLIIDLRDNPGGFMEDAVKIANLFLPKNKLVVVSQGRAEDVNLSMITKDNAFDLKTPIVILINRNSASASEILSGALQDYDRAVLIGERSFGKGLVQRIYDVGYNSKIKITVSKYYIPSGRCVQEIDYKNHKNNDDTLTKFYTANGRVVYQGSGISPDIQIKPDSSDIIQVLKDSMYIFTFCNSYLNSIDTSKISSFSDVDFSDFNLFLEFLEKINFYKNFPSINYLESLPDYSNNEIKIQKNEFIKKYKENIKKNIVQNKKEIIDLINKQIVLRKFYHKGFVEFSVNHDKEVKKAIEILKDSTKYYQILGY